LEQALTAIGALNAIHRKPVTMHETSNCQLLVRGEMQAERGIILPFSFPGEP